MKKEIHPKVYTDTKVTCACGNTFTTTSTLPEIKVEICSACHPFYTGQRKFVDTEKRIDKFNKKVQKMKEKQAIRQKIEKDRKEKKSKEDITLQKPKSVKEILQKLKSEESK